MGYAQMVNAGFVGGVDWIYLHAGGANGKGCAA
jgi:hypothetical protein